MHPYKSLEALVSIFASALSWLVPILLNFCYPRYRFTYCYYSGEATILDLTYHKTSF